MQYNELYYKSLSYQYECRSLQSFQCCWAPSEERLFSSPQRDTLPPLSGCQWLWTPTVKSHKAKQISADIHEKSWKRHNILVIRCITYIIIITHHIENIYLDGFNSIFNLKKPSFWWESVYSSEDGEIKMLIWYSKCIQICIYNTFHTF